MQFYNEKILRPNDSKGYLKVTLSKNNRQRTFRIHVLVAKTFISNPENKPEVNHKEETNIIII